MTEKELMYVEDTISHLDQVEQLCTNFVEELTTKEVVKIVEKIIKKVSSNYDDLMNLLNYREECKDE
ncbi:MAG: hypothetical protein IJA94_00865 [Bacilli bacterium]|nr:hypothetical protein [Bacilli bacterium]